ncbi:hypothetical protein [Prauserella cavernicola]|uniref:Uncharacterized protein n=1 Tax=Prauserella cavernicola TaxID=2800127 RepID=A0A934QP56_9PSEU|nr:hypothetical protein [Prauserella cavernicola]MBK1782849.1 hypothetical protein [Prauserella cavernicola]
MVRAALAILIAVALLATGSASAAFAPPQRRQAVAPPKRAPQQPHEIRIMVSGPDDTLMRVARGGAKTQVALRGEPFEHAFTEPAGGNGHLGITVAAASAEPKGRAVTCEIRVDGAVVSRVTAKDKDASGFAQVLCTIPTPV